MKKYIEGYPKTTKVADWRYDVVDGKVVYYEYATGQEFFFYAIHRVYAWFGFVAFWGGLAYGISFIAPTLWEVLTMTI